jgi:hypothetical protein
MGERAKEVKQGFRRAGLWLLGMAWLGLVFAGMAIAFTPSPHSVMLGWVLLGLAAVIALPTMNRWVKIFPGLLAYGILGSILELSDGHAVGLPHTPVSRTDAIVSLVFCAVGTAVSVTFASRKLRITDRAALLAFVVCFFWQAADPKLIRVALGAGLALLLLAWLYDRFRSRARRASHAESHLPAH